MGDRSPVWRVALAGAVGVGLAICLGWLATPEVEGPELVLHEALEPVRPEPVEPPVVEGESVTEELAVQQAVEEGLPDEASPVTPEAQQAWRERLQERGAEVSRWCGATMPTLHCRGGACVAVVPEWNRLPELWRRPIQIAEWAAVQVGLPPELDRCATVRRALDEHPPGHPYVGPFRLPAGGFCVGYQMPEDPEAWASAQALCAMLGAE